MEVPAQPTAEVVTEEGSPGRMDEAEDSIAVQIWVEGVMHMTMDTCGHAGANIASSKSK